MQSVTTERTPCTFTVKEFDEDTPWICVEEHQPGLNILKGGSLGILLREGVSYSEAKEIAVILREKVAGISFTH
jgi:hypothetical protein